MVIARRVVRQFMRDRRSVVMLFGVPIAVMSLLAAVVGLDVGKIRAGLYAEGTSTFFSSDMVDTLSEHLEVEEVFDLTDAKARLTSGELDAVLILPNGFLEERLLGRTGTIAIQIVGDNPAKTASVLRELKDSLSGVVDGVPALMPESCSDECTDAVNTKFPTLEERLSYGNSDLRLVDFHGSFFATIFVFFFGFIFSSLAFFRERTEGTLERMRVSPARPSEIFIGYLAAFFVSGMVQATVVLLFMIWVLDVYIAGSVALLYVAIIPTVLIAEALGIFVSAFSKREFQVVQFVPMIILPQILLSNLLWPVQDFPTWLRPVAMAMPMYHADRAARVVMLHGEGLSAMLPSIGVLVGMCLFVMALSARMIRRN